MNLVQGTIAVLNDAKYFLEQISTEKYSLPITAMSNSTIGQHTRHFIEFYQCLLAQADSNRINYCLRKRDLNIEQYPDIALDAIAMILKDINSLDLEKTVSISSTKDGAYDIESTLGREVYYNIEHCIHHLALIRIGLHLIAPEVDVPKHFGLAPSTIQHRKLVTQ